MLRIIFKNNFKEILHSSYFNNELNFILICDRLKNNKKKNRDNKLMTIKILKNNDVLDDFKNISALIINLLLL